MKFKLDTTDRFYTKERAEILRELGFEFEIRNLHRELYGRTDYNEDFYKTPKKVYIEIETLEELVDFCKKFGDIVMTPDTIEIYDGYRE